MSNDKILLYKGYIEINTHQTMGLPCIDKLQNQELLKKEKMLKRETKRVPLIIPIIEPFDLYPFLWKRHVNTIDRLSCGRTHVLKIVD